MASIGLYGVYYSKCVKENGVTTAYDGSVKQMGKAISASFEPNVPEDNPLYANNGIVENDISAGNGGELTMTLDRMTLETHADLYGTTVSDVSVTVDGQTVAGKEITIHNYQRYDTHCCQMPFDARRMDGDCDGAKLHFDFDTLTRSE